MRRAGRGGRLVAPSRCPPRSRCCTERTSGMRSVTTVRPQSSAVSDVTAGLARSRRRRAVLTSAGGGDCAGGHGPRRRRPAGPAGSAGPRSPKVALASASQRVLERHHVAPAAGWRRPQGRLRPPRPRPPAGSPAAPARRRRRRRPATSDTLPCGSMSSTRTSTSSPRSTTSSTRSTRLPRPSLEMWTRPSRPGQDVDEGAELGDVDHLARGRPRRPRPWAGRGSSRCAGGPRRPRRRPWRRWSRCRSRPSSSTAMSAPVSCCRALMTLPFGPMTSPILSIGISRLTIFGAVSRTVGPGLGDGLVP